MLELLELELLLEVLLLVTLVTVVVVVVLWKMGITVARFCSRE